MARKKTVTGSAADESAMEERVVAFAQQLGRMVGTVERKTTGWLDMAPLSDQLTRIRDGAADLLSHLGGGAATGRKEPRKALDSIPESPLPDAGSRASSGGASKGRARKPASPREAAKPRPAGLSGRSREPVAAPGKRHRKPPASMAGAEHSNEEIAKARATDRNRRTRGR